MLIRCKSPNLIHIPGKTLRADSSPVEDACTAPMRIHGAVAIDESELELRKEKKSVGAKCHSGCLYARYGLWGDSPL